MQFKLTAKRPREQIQRVFEAKDPKEARRRAWIMLRGLKWDAAHLCWHPGGRL